MNDKSYVLTAATHEATEPIDVGGSEGVADYSNRFTCIPLEVPFRPVRQTPKPVAEGTQPAIVVGPAGEEIYTDEHGRVKVQFIWDREGKKDDNSSCWIRVSQQWAGPNWGAMFIPHIGHEVIVDFVEGDPDRPIIIGSVYNGNNKPADALPENKTRSVIRSWGDNDIIIEDKEGDKHIQIKQANGNEIFLHESSPDIEIKQECGNKVHMKASGPDIEITQACGNEILMREAEGIQMRDKYGNEVVLDASSGFIHIGSPSHNSFVDIGKSLKFGSNSDNELFVGGERKITIAANTHESYVGTKTALSLAADISSVNGIVVKRYYAYENSVNYRGRHKRTVGPVTVDSDTTYTIIGGFEDVAQIILDTAEAIIKYDESSFLKINNLGVEIKTPKKVVIDANEVEIKSSGDIRMNPGGMVRIPEGKWDFGDGSG
jgi:type VI secretion system secreted protein VgrG